jgi:anti-sigma28 factor (negative regulator of flagellin synthesis)
MKISENRIEQVVQQYLQQVRTKTDKQAESVNNKEEVAAGEDSVSITAKSKEFEKAKELYSLLPDIREEEIKEAQGKLQKGNRISSEEIAEKIIHQSLIDGEA